MTQKELNKILDSHEAWIDDHANGKQLQLNGVDLSGMDFHGRNLDWARFEFCTLDNASFRNASLAFTGFHCCAMKNADLCNTNCYCTNFHAANMLGVKCVEADFTCVDFRNACLSPRSFKDACTVHCAFSHSTFDIAECKPLPIFQIGFPLDLEFYEQITLKAYGDESEWTVSANLMSQHYTIEEFKNSVKIAYVDEPEIEKRYLDMLDLLIKAARLTQ